MNRGRRGGVLIRLIAMLVVVGVAGTLCWGALNNQRVTGSWSFHPLDSNWWSPTAADGTKVPAADVLDDARVFGDQVGQALWGNGGLIERAEKWWDENDGAKTGVKTTPPTKIVPPPGSAPVVAPAPVGNPAEEKGQPLITNAPLTPTAPTSLRELLEQRLQQADATFQAGLANLKAASPVAGDATLSTIDRLARVGVARERFAAVEGDLSETIPAYEAIPQHDQRKAATARQLREFNKQMLEMTGGMP